MIQEETAIDILSFAAEDLHVYQGADQGQRSYFFECSIQWPNHQLSFVVVKGSGPSLLLGLDWLRVIHLDWSYLKDIPATPSSKYQEVVDHYSGESRGGSVGSMKPPFLLEYRTAKSVAH